MSAPPLCHYCGKSIAKMTTGVYLHDRPLGENKMRWNAIHNFSRHLSVAAYPKTKAECQALTNKTVVSVSYGANINGKIDASFIGRFTEWDGESYEVIDGYFCTGNHARDFGRLMAQAGHCTKAYNEAVRKQRKKSA